MIVILAAFLALASAAPHDPDSSGGSKDALSDSFSEGILDTNKFWKELETEMHKMEEIMQEFSKRFPSTSATAGIEGNEYVITVNLTGFDEKDIVVKARECTLMIQAVHKDESGNLKSFMDLRTLPSDVDASGSWTFENNILRIHFPLKKKGEDETTEAVTDENPSANAEATTHRVDLKNEVEFVPVKY